MQVKRVNFPQILKDNEETYFRYLEAVVSSVDYESSMQFTKRELGIGVRISPSTPETFSSILDCMKKLHTQFGIHVDFSKSMKASSTINFNIDF